jgi:hypothetical protein
MVAWFDLKDPADVLGKTDADLFAPEHAKVALRDEQEISRRKLRKTGSSLRNDRLYSLWP